MERLRVAPLWLKNGQLHHFPTYNNSSFNMEINASTCIFTIFYFCNFILLGTGNGNNNGNNNQGGMFGNGNGNNNQGDLNGVLNGVNNTGVSKG